MKIKFKGQEIEIPEGATFKVVGGDLVVSPGEMEFKDGDIVRTTHFIAIYKKATGINLDFFNYVELEDDFDNDNVNELHYNSSLMPKELRFATEEEKQKLFYALKSKGKKWDPEIKQIEDILKVGDICIFWDDEKCEANINTLTNIDESDSTYRSNNGHWFDNAIKCTSLEQYRNFIREV